MTDLECKMMDVIVALTWAMNSLHQTHRVENADMERLTDAFCELTDLVYSSDGESEPTNIIQFPARYKGDC